ncbi:MAG TPA: iron ABC transporter permease [Stellaceae bacterium]|nr:iron ABC transporter permease [Stellaceae bacterium]
MIVGAALALLVLVATATALGPYRVTPGELAAFLAAKATGAASTLPAPAETVILQIRLPRIIGATAVGAALAAAGAAYQSLFRNPLVSPDILGVSSGAAFGAVVGIYLSLPVLAIEAASFAGGLAAVIIVYTIAAAIRGRDAVLVLVLAGVVIGALFGAGVGLLKYLADPYNQLPAITFWLLGSLAAANPRDLTSLVPALVLGLLPLALLRWRIDVMTLGDEEATALGVNTRMLRVIVIAAATLMTSAAVAASGIIGWVGLVVPHLARLVVGPAFNRLLPVSVLFGAGYLLAVDTVARTIGAVELPLGVLTAALGTPVFLWLLAFSRRPAWS